MWIYESLLKKHYHMKGNKNCVGGFMSNIVLNTLICELVVTMPCSRPMYITRPTTSVKLKHACMNHL
jgi:hypothetical protein